MNKFEMDKSKQEGIIKAIRIAYEDNHADILIKSFGDVVARDIKTAQKEEGINKQEGSTEIIVFTNSGNTYSFKNVENLTPTTHGFEFDYTGVATGVKRKCGFNYTSVAGYALA